MPSNLFSSRVWLAEERIFSQEKKNVRLNIYCNDQVVTSPLTFFLVPASCCVLQKIKGNMYELFLSGNDLTSQRCTTGKGQLHNSLA